jgi:hypothetical protein
MRAASTYYRGMFSFTPYVLPEVMSDKRTLTQDSVFDSKLKDFMCDSDLLCSSIIVNNQEYKNGDLLVFSVSDANNISSVSDANNISVGLLQAILLKNHKIYVVVQKYGATRNILGYF